MKVIAISAHDGSGKSTLARTMVGLIEEAGMKATILPFAHALKLDLREKLGFEDPFAKPTPPEMRELMRAYGWAARVQFGMDIWLRRWQERLGVLDGVDVVIVDDMRHLNEYTWLKARGAHIVTLTVNSTEPDRSASQPAIVSEIWDIRDTHVHTKALVPIEGQRSAHIPLGRPEDFQGELLTRFREMFLNLVLLSGSKGDYVPRLLNPETPSPPPAADSPQHDRGEEAPAMQAPDATPSRDYWYFDAWYLVDPESGVQLARCVGVAGLSTTSTVNKIGIHRVSILHRAGFDRRSHDMRLVVAGGQGRLAPEYPVRLLHASSMQANALHAELNDVTLEIIGGPVSVAFPPGSVSTHRMGDLCGTPYTPSPPPLSEEVWDLRYLTNDMHCIARCTGVNPHEYGFKADSVCFSEPVGAFFTLPLSGEFCLRRTLRGHSQEYCVLFRNCESWHVDAENRKVYTGVIFRNLPHAD